MLAATGLEVLAQPSPLSLLPLSPRASRLLASLRDFMEGHVLPAEAKWAAEVYAAADPWLMPHSAVMEGLKQEAQRRGLWNLFLPGVSGLSQAEYARFAEVMGRSLIASEACNCDSPDSGNMEVLHLYGSPQQKKTWLEPLLAGKIRSCFCMTEPDVASSDATNMQCTITPVDGGRYFEVNGRKWWTTGAGSPRCVCVCVSACLCVCSFWTLLVTLPPLWALHTEACALTHAPASLALLVLALCTRRQQRQRAGPG